MRGRGAAGLNDLNGLPDNLSAPQGGRRPREGDGPASLARFFGLAYWAVRLVPLFVSPLAWRVLDVLVGGMMRAVALCLPCAGATRWGMAVSDEFCWEGKVRGGQEA